MRWQGAQPPHAEGNADHRRHHHPPGGAKIDFLPALQQQEPGQGGHHQGGDWRRHLHTDQQGQQGHGDQRLAETKRRFGQARQE